MHVYAISRGLCRGGTQKLYESKGISGNSWAARASSHSEAYWVSWMRAVLVIEELGLTSILRCENYRSRPGRKLRNGYDPETDGDWNAFHRDGVNPVTIFTRNEMRVGARQKGFPT